MANRICIHCDKEKNAKLREIEASIEVNNREIERLQKELQEKSLW